MNKIKKEIPVLDNLRAIAAWSVCIYHFVCTTNGFVNKNSFVFKASNFGHYGVELFFVISGLVIPWSLYHTQYRLKNFFTFFIKRLARLEPPYLVSIGIVLVLLSFRKFSPAYDQHEIPITLKQVLLHLGYLIPFFNDVKWLNNVYWTLAIEFQYYLFIGLVYSLFVSSRTYLRYMAYGLLVVIPVCMHTGGHFLPYYLPVFGIGILIFLYKTKAIKITELAGVSILFAGVIYLYNEALVSLVTILTEISILLLFNRSNKILAWLGKFSYSVYLLHAMVGAAAVNVLSHYADLTWKKIAVVLTGILITFCSSYLMFLLVEKPSKKLSSKLNYKAGNE